jgi:hypothetical protein
MQFIPTSVFHSVALFVFCLSTLLHTQPTKAAEAEFSVEVPSGQSKTLRLKNLPAGTILKAKLVSNGDLGILLIDSEAYKRLPAAKRPLFRAAMERKLSFSVRIEKSDHYFIVFNNKSATIPRSVQIKVQAEHPLQRVKSTLTKFEYILYQYLKFDAFPIRIQSCNTSPPKNPPDALILCTELVQELKTALQDKTMIGGLLTFSLMQSAGHLILAQWGHPRAADESFTDEFSAALLIILGQKEQLKRVMNSFLRNLEMRNSSSEEREHRWGAISQERARRILQLLGDEQFMHNWQAILIPHMQTRQLRRLRGTPQPWTDLDLIKRELALHDGKINI